MRRAAACARAGMHRFIVLAIDRTHRTHRSGSDVAREDVPHEGSHPDNGTWASSSAITDGEHVIAYFESSGLYAYDMNGTLVWQKDLGDKRMRNQFGEGSTPALYGNTWSSSGITQRRVVHRGARQARPARSCGACRATEIDTWATPLVVEAQRTARRSSCRRMKRVRSYDLETGSRRLGSAGLTMNPIPSPVVRRRHGVRHERLPRATI